VLWNVTQVYRRFARISAGQAALGQAYKAFREECESPEARQPSLHVERSDEKWELDRVDDFLELYARGPSYAVLHDDAGGGLFSFRDDWGNCELTIRLDSLSRVRRIMAALEPEYADAQPFTVFVGHGRDPQWHVLVSHLRELHHFRVVSYETIAEFGQPAALVLDLAARSVSVALLVHAAEVQTVDGEWHAMPNVVHETGFFSAHLGPDRALVLREDSCRPFTNIAGLTELRFSDRNIREVFGDVVAMLRRHSGNLGLSSFGKG